MKEKKSIVNKISLSRQKCLQITGMIVIIGLILNFAYQVYSKNLLHPPSRSRCDLHEKTCSVVIPEGKIISLTIDPKTLASEQPLTFTVNLQRFTPNKVGLFINTLPANKASKGTTLVMKSIGNNQYQTQTTLHKTNDPQQKWVALVEVTSGTTIVAAAFRFTVSAPTE